MFKQKKLEKVLQDVAWQFDDTEEHARIEIEKIWDRVTAHPDPLIRGYWTTMLKKGKRPTAEEIINRGLLAYDLYCLMLLEGEKITGQKQRRSLTPLQVADMATGCVLADDKVVRGALQAAIYIQEEKEGGSENGTR